MPNQSVNALLVNGVRFWSPNSAIKSAFLGTFKSAFAQKSAQKSAIYSAIKSNFLWKVQKIVLFKVQWWKSAK